MYKSKFVIQLVCCPFVVFLALQCVVFNADARPTAQYADGLPVYSVTDRAFIAELPSSTQFREVRSQGDWSIIRFDQPAVPVWVSEDYVTMNQGVATVTADRLNARIRPEVGALVIKTIPQGFQSEVLDAQAGFVSIFAPADWLFATSDSGSWRLNATERQIQSRPERRPAASQPAGDQRSEHPVEPGPAAQIQVPASSKRAIVNETARLHRISPGATISLQVFGEPDLSQANVRVPESGAVSFPLIGSTQVAGKTTSEIESEVRQVLAGGYINNPQLSVTIESYRPIFIRGAVQSTGAFPYTEGLTVAKAIALAGGSKNSAKLDGISILRDGNLVQTQLSLDSQYQIASGDIITVEEEFGVGEEAGFYIYLHGEVQKPGEYLYRRGLTVEKAIVLAGGFTLRASKKRISVARTIDGEEAPQRLRKVKLHLPVEPGDIIDVGARWF